jgi:hypothetical protein
MLKCRDLSRMVAADEIGTFGFMQRMELKFHLFMCSHCRNYVAQIRTLGQGARDLAADAEPDAQDLEKLEIHICTKICRDHPDGT